VQSRFDWARNLDAYENVLRNARHGSTCVESGTARLEACP